METKPFSVKNFFFSSLGSFKLSTDIIANRLLPRL